MCGMFMCMGVWGVYVGGGVGSVCGWVGVCGECVWMGRGVWGGGG